MSDGNSIDATPRDLWWFRKNVPCLDACPVKTDAGRYVQLIAEGRLAEAYRVARSPNPIASICGRACGAPCEDACRRGKIDAPVTIRALKRFLTEQFGPEALSSKGIREMIAAPSGGGSTTPGHIDFPGARPDAGASKRNVAVVGAGPAGLACANDLALMCYRVTVFEAMEHAGGMLRYGIPAYRLPRDVIDCQVREIESLGVEFRYSTPLRPGFGVRELKEQGYEAIFLAVGASRGRAVPIEGSDADGVIKAIDYLLNINRGYRVPLGGKVVVIGGGLVAIDAARTAVRALVPGLVMSAEEEQSVAAGTMRVALDAAREAARRGALEVTVASLESGAEMPAMKSAQGREELDIAREEGVTFMPGWGPKQIVIRDGHAVGIELVKCVKVFDEAGRFRPQFDENDKRVVDADAVILAIGQAPDLSFVTPEDGVTITPAGTLKIDPVTLETGIAGVFAGGDAAFPPSLLITCAQHGKVAARGIDAYLRGKPLGQPRMHVTIEELPTDTYKMVDRYEQKRRDIPLVPLSRRTGITEVESTFTADDAREQAERCLYCHIHPIYDGAKCILCNRCVDICPEHCLHFTSAGEIADQERIAGVMAEAETRSAFLYDEAVHPLRPVRDQVPDLGDYDAALSVRRDGRLMDGDRRKILRFIGKGSVLAAFLAQIGAAGRAFFPNVLYEPPSRFKLKRPDDYPDGYTLDEAHRLYVIRQKEAFHVISAICTHLGCNVQWRDTEFDCPCHGSRFRPDGTVISGPAPRPLDWFATTVSPDGFLEVDSASDVARNFRLVIGGKAKA